MALLTWFMKSISMSFFFVRPCQYYGILLPREGKNGNVVRLVKNFVLEAGTIGSLQNHIELHLVSHPSRAVGHDEDPGRSEEALHGLEEWSDDLGNVLKIRTQQEAESISRGVHRPKFVCLVHPPQKLVAAYLRPTTFLLGDVPSDIVPKLLKHVGIPVGEADGSAPSIARLEMRQQVVSEEAAPT